MREVLWFTQLLNKLFGHSALALLLALHIHPADPASPIPNYVAMQILIGIILMVFGTIVGRGLSVESPRGWQHIIEWLWLTIREQTEEIIGHEGHLFIAFLTTLSIFILLCNLLGLFPTVISPTANPRVPLGCALMAFFVYHAAGVRHHGIWGYLKTFTGPMWQLAPLMFPIEIISNLARVLSLTVRLYANMFAGDMVTIIMVALLPISGIAFLGLHTFVAVLQTFIFVLLTMVYLGGAVAEEH
jgi:F-type H+-transporting ATPase subunit a